MEFDLSFGYQEGSKSRQSKMYSIFLSNVRLGIHTGQHRSRSQCRQRSPDIANSVYTQSSDVLVRLPLKLLVSLSLSCMHGGPNDVQREHAHFFKTFQHQISATDFQKILQWVRRRQIHLVWTSPYRLYLIDPCLFSTLSICVSVSVTAVMSHLTYFGV